MLESVSTFFGALFGGDVRGVLQSKRAFLHWFFVGIIAAHFGAVLFCFLIAMIVSGGVGGSLGVDNLFQDSQHVADIIATQAPGAILNSPSMLTSLMLFYAAFLIIFFSRISFKVALTPAKPGSRDFLQLLQRFIFWAFLLYLAFLTLWLFVGRGILDDCDPDPLLADCAGEIRGGEHLRILYGFALGLVASVASLYVARLLRLGLGWAIVVLEALIRAAGFLTEVPAVRKRLGTVGQLSLQSARGQLQSSRGWLDKNRRVIEYTLYAFPTIFLLYFALIWPKIIPAVAIFTALLLIFVVVRVLFGLPVLYRYGLLALALAWMGFRDHESFKLTFDGIPNADASSAYDMPLDLRAAANTEQDFAPGNRAASEFTCAEPQKAFDAVDPLEALESWRVRQNLQYGEGKPLLVMVATSGGAYRSAFWTALVLDRLSARSGQGGSLEGLSSSIRVITGASGGMVGAAYFATLAEPFGTQVFEELSWQDYASFPDFSALGNIPVTLSPQRQVWDAMEEDVRLSQVLIEGDDADNALRTRYPIPRDTLSPVAQQLLQHDLGTIFRPERVALDRGKVLERQWLKLSKSFGELRDGEEQGWRPSMIFSPMIVETGQPLIISNLDLSFLPRLESDEAQSFFKMFPCAHGSFKVATAARMNATFPFLSPAVSLPTVPERRVVDAGYYDNYGISLATAYLNDPKVKDWIKTNTRGVLVLQLRAFPLKTGRETHCVKPKPETDGSLLEGLEWLTSPVEAAVAARSTSMAFRNEQELRATIASYGRRPDKTDFIRTVIFANSANVSMNWALPEDEAEAMRTCLDHQWSEKSKDLSEIWWNVSAANLNTGSGD